MEQTRSRTLPFNIAFFVLLAAHNRLFNFTDVPPSTRLRLNNVHLTAYPDFCCLCYFSTFRPVSRARHGRSHKEDQAIPVFDADGAITDDCVGEITNRQEE